MELAGKKTIVRSLFYLSQVIFDYITTIYTKSFQPLQRIITGKGTRDDLKTVIAYKCIQNQMTLVYKCKLNYCRLLLKNNYICK
ncbi:MAG: hypothetical protein PWQ06_788 [Anaerophaga sp.]|nr:hypothetical protein [Anaerophaga sp.]